MRGYAKERMAIWRGCGAAVLGAMVLAGAAVAAQGATTRQHHAASGPADASNTAAAGQCAACHAAQVNDFAANVHGRPTTAPGAKTLTCGTCHGAETEHLANRGGRPGASDRASGSKEQVTELCLTCHGGKHAAYERSPHGKAAVSCTECHSIHHAAGPSGLRTAAQAELCFQCHADEKASFAMSFHHKVMNGLVECSDCHDPHGTQGEERRGAASLQNSLCTNCHTETAGPFVYEHPVMKTEGCTACHVSHGGAHPHLLLRGDTDSICRDCHFPRPDSKTGAHLAAAKEQKSCIDCHADVHGSNVSPTFLRTR